MNGELQEVRSRANELLLRGEWKDCIDAYSQLTVLLEHQEPCDDGASKKALCLAFSNRAEARFRLRDFCASIQDCGRALQIDPNHLKSIVCMGKALLEIDQYSKASKCFERAVALQPHGHRGDSVGCLLRRSRKLDAQSRTGRFDLTDWILNGFDGPSPDLAGYIEGPVEIRRSDISGRGLFVTKNVSAGTLLFVSKAVAVGRAILPGSTDDGLTGEQGNRLVVWKDFVDQVRDAALRSEKTLKQLYTLPTGDEDEGSHDLGIPNMDIFRPDVEETTIGEVKLDMGRILKILDANALTENPVLGKKSVNGEEEVCGVGLWILASFINHSCNPNARRLHVGDRILVHSSKDLRKGEEITFSYFDTFLPLKKRQELGKNWGFLCKCERCKVEEIHRQDLEAIEKEMECASDLTDMVVRLEDEVLRKKVKGTREKAFVRVSYWEAYCRVLRSGRVVKRWGRRIPEAGSLIDAAEAVVGGDDRVLAAAYEFKDVNGSYGRLIVDDMSRVSKIGRAIYGKHMKKQAIRALLQKYY
ncbi:methyltransferase FGSG_00040 [Nymphaea colorata]|uniref:SET domain-containing protein n=1 Tax=Nymphaea colorata TaxID=210225 RepID=A0A5K1AP32_9MAGN|nr:methyltransferase FGSG_00040 [Nymphaea colorata]